MKITSAPSVPYHPSQCQKCKLLLAEDRCKGFVTKDPLGDMFGIFKGESNEICPKFIPSKSSEILPKTELQKLNTIEIKCAKCNKYFEWKDAYNQQDTPASSEFHPQGHGNFRPRAFCPHCGFLVAEWDIDQSENRNQWKWYNQNEKINTGRDLPPSPLSFWGKPIPIEARIPVSGEQIDLSKMAEGFSNEEFLDAAVNGDTGTLKKQISSGVDINTKNYKGETAVMLAAMKGHTEIVKILIEAKVDINDQNVYGMHTPIILAAIFGKLDTVKLLVRSGANLSLRNQFGKSALEAAHDSNHSDVVIFLEGAGSVIAEDNQFITEDRLESISSPPIYEPGKVKQPTKTRVINNYSDVPWYRRSFVNVIFIMSSFVTYFVFPGVFIVLILMLTGDIYKNEKEFFSLKTWGLGIKILVIVFATLHAFVYLISFILQF